MTPAGWATFPFETVVASKGAGSAGLQQRDWLEEGEFPVIGQGAEDIEGWTNRSDLLLIPTPAIVLYGGHTRRTKFVSRPFVPGPNVKILKPNASVHPKFLFYYLKFLPIESKGYADHFPLVRKSVVPVPPIAEQQRIVAILDEAFAGIATAKANAEKNLQNSRGIFDGHLQSAFTQRGTGWMEKRLVEVSRQFGRGKSKHRPRNEPSLYGGPYPFIQTGDISNADHWLTDYTQTYSDLGLSQSLLWPKGTICIAIVGATVGETAILDFEACFPDSVIGIVVDDQLADCEYVEFLLQSFKAILKEKGKGTARDNINLGTFEAQTFPFPALKKQKEAAAKLNELRAETQRLESIYTRKLAALEALKQSLLYQAFSGQL